MKKINTTALIGILVGVVAAACLICGIIIFFATRNNGEPSKATADTAAATTAATTFATAAPSTAPAQPATTGNTSVNATNSTDTATDSTDAPSDNVPDDMRALLSAAGYDENSLNAVGAGQLIVVNSSGTSAQISFYQQSNGKWVNDPSLSCSGFVGSEGTVTVMSEQISGTPKGLYSIGSAFYQYGAPDTGLNSFQITDQTYWIDDPDSQFYNQRVEGTDNQDWKSAEHMSTISGYKYGFVINYNMPAEYNKGSAIFFHIGGRPTQGCVAASEDMVLAYLAKLNASENPYILVI